MSCLNSNSWIQVHFKIDIIMKLTATTFYVFFFALTSDWSSYTDQNLQYTITQSIVLQGQVESQTKHLLLNNSLEHFVVVLLNVSSNIADTIIPATGVQEEHNHKLDVQDKRTLPIENR